MAIKIRTNIFPPLNKPKTYMVYILYDKYVSWDFCIRILMGVFNKNFEQANAIANEILTEGEGLCGAYMFEIAESKAEVVEKQAEKEGLSLSCLVEEV